MQQRIITRCFLVLLLSISFFKVEGQPSSQYSNISRYIGTKLQEASRVIDSAKVRIDYSLQYMPDTTKPEQLLKDRKVLLAGDTYTHFYSYYQRQIDSAQTADFDRGKASARLKTPAGVESEGYDIYTSAKTRTVLECITNLSIYRYKEPVEYPQWTIGSDTCRVLSYTCQKATARFRGREWTVWFSRDIPLNTGPWKLGGLPGLIMKAADSKNHYVFECIGLEQFREKREPVLRLGANIFCTRDEYREAQRQFYDNYVNALLALGYNVYIVDDDGNDLERIPTPNTTFAERRVSWSTHVHVSERYKKLPFNPIELE